MRVGSFQVFSFLLLEYGELFLSFRVGRVLELLGTARARRWHGMAGPLSYQIRLHGCKPLIFPFNLTSLYCCGNNGVSQRRRWYWRQKPGW